MKKLIVGFLFSVLIAGCGGDNTITSPPASPDNGGGSPTTTVSSIDVLASSPTLLSDDSTPITITARVLNAANQALANESVTIQTNSGFLTDIQTTTNANGVVTAILHTADPTNRDITVTATAAAVTDTVTVSVTGSRLSISGSSAIVRNASAQYTVSLLDAGGDGIANQAIAVTSTSGNTLSSANLTTNGLGQATVTLTGTVAGADTLRVNALGLTATQAITVSDDSFTFTAPSANTEIVLGQTATATVTWSISGAPQSGQVISFSTTRGTLNSQTVTTNGSGQASVTIVSNNAGPATLTASTANGTSATLPLEFVATNPSTIDVQASPTTVATTGQSTITAIVRDANGNLVKNQTIDFILTDITGGNLSFGSAQTDSQGRATTVYTGGTTTSAVNGVNIRAQLRSNTAITDTIGITVARREVFISLGTGNKIGEDDNDVQYIVPYVIQVTDANGNGVANVSLTVRVVSQLYRTGVHEKLTDGWDINTFVSQCIDEDALLGPSSVGYRNGILDLVNGVQGTGEDFNSNGSLEAGNIATVTPTGVTTDANGFAYINVYYPQEYAYWVYATLSATTAVQGSEYSRSVNFWLPGQADDFNDPEVSPPGQTSPFGIADYACP